MKRSGLLSKIRTKSRPICQNSRNPDQRGGTGVGQKYWGGGWVKFFGGIKFCFEGRVVLILFGGRGCSNIPIQRQGRCRGWGEVSVNYERRSTSPMREGPCQRWGVRRGRCWRWSKVDVNDDGTSMTMAKNRTTMLSKRSMLKRPYGWSRHVWLTPYLG